MSEGETPSLVERAIRWRPAAPPRPLLATAIALLCATGTGLLWLDRSDPPRPAARPATSRPPVRADAAEILARLAARLPQEAMLHRAAQEADGRLTLEIDTPDPERLRAALRAEPRLALLRTESEAQVPDRGYRVRLAGRATGAAPPPAAGGADRLRQDAAGLLIERIEPAAGGTRILVSGAEAAVLRLIARHRFAAWQLVADLGGVRLDGVAVGRGGVRGGGARGPMRVLFAEQAAAPPDGPRLAGIVGRLPDGAVALVRTDAGRARSVAVGQSVEGWTLAALAADAAVFTRGGERLRVTLPEE